jgi:hypothetical protein
MVSPPGIQEGLPAFNFSTIFNAFIAVKFFYLEFLTGTRSLRGSEGRCILIGQGDFSFFFTRLSFSPSSDLPWSQKRDFRDSAPFKIY